MNYQVVLTEDGEELTVNTIEIDNDFAKRHPHEVKITIYAWRGE
jgi:hypothetical protein